MAKKDLRDVCEDILASTLSGISERVRDGKQIYQSELQLVLRAHRVLSEGRYSDGVTDALKEIPTDRLEDILLTLQQRAENPN